jgi:hypothetical protein
MLMACVDVGERVVVVLVFGLGLLDSDLLCLACSCPATADAAEDDRSNDDYANNHNNDDDDLHHSKACFEPFAHDFKSLAGTCVTGSRLGVGRCRS